MIGSYSSGDFYSERSRKYWRFFIIKTSFILPKYHQCANYCCCRLKGHNYSSILIQSKTFNSEQFSYTSLPKVGNDWTAHTPVKGGGIAELCSEVKNIIALTHQVDNHSIQTKYPIHYNIDKTKLYIKLFNQCVLFLFQYHSI